MERKKQGVYRVLEDICTGKRPGREAPFTTDVVVKSQNITQEGASPGCDTTSAMKGGTGGYLSPGLQGMSLGRSYSPAAETAGAL